MLDCLRLVVVAVVAALLVGMHASYAAAYHACTPKSVSQWELLLTSSNCEAYTLVSLDLHELSDTETASLVAGISQQETITALSFVRTKMGVNAIKLVHAALDNNILHVLDIAHTTFDSDVFRALVAALEATDGLVRLDLVNCMLDDEHVRSLAAALKGWNTPISYLNLFGNHISSAGAEYLSSALARSPALLSLELSMNPLGDEGVASVAVIMETCPSLESLSLSSVEATKTGARMIGMSLSHLKRLSFSKNHHLGAEGGRAFRKGLLAGNDLHHLDLSMCNLGSEGATSVLTGLKDSRQLKQLYLAVNNIRDDCATLSAFIVTASTVEVIDLSNNPLTTSWCNQLTTTLENSVSFCLGSLQKIVLRKAPIEQSCKEKLETLLQRQHCADILGSMQDGTCDADGACYSGGSEMDDDGHVHTHREMYQSMDTNLLALIAGYKLEKCITVLAKENLMQRDRLISRCCHKDCVSELHLPLTSDEEIKQWNDALAVICS